MYVTRISSLSFFKELPSAVCSSELDNKRLLEFGKMDEPEFRG